MHFVTLCNTRSAAIIQNRLQSLHHRLLLTAVAQSAAVDSTQTQHPSFLSCSCRVIPRLHHKTLCEFPLSCLASLHLFLFWNLHKVLLAAFPTTLLPGLCRPGHSPRESAFCSPLQTTVPPSSSSVLIPASESAHRCAFSFLALSCSLRNTTLG